MQGFLDAMLAGCVPVTFQLEAAQSQWPLHWESPETAMQCSVLVPREQALRNMTAALQGLVALSRDLRAMHDKLQCIARIGHRFQYSLPLPHDGSSSTPQAVERKEYDHDALNVVLRHLLQQSNESQI